MAENTKTKKNQSKANPPSEDEAENNDEALTPRQELFVEKYFRYRNGTQAAFEAGFGKTRNAASVYAVDLLANPKIKNKIDQLIKEQSKRLQIDADDVLLETKRLGFSNIQLLFNEDGSVKNPKDWPEEIARCVSSVQVDELFESQGRGNKKVHVGYTKKVKLWPKNSALESLGKYFELFPDKLKVTGVIADDIKAARERLKKKR